MERIRGSIYKRYKSSTKIYIDKLENIAELLSETGGELEIISDKYKYKNLNDLLENNKGKYVLSDLSIKTHDPSFHIDIEKDWLSLWAHHDDAYCSGVISMVEDVLNTCKRRYNVFTNGWLLFVCFLFLQAFIFLGDRVTGVFTYSMVVIAFFVTYLVWSFYYFYSITHARKHFIILRNSYEEVNFFQSNRDQLIVVVITAAVTAIVTAIVTTAITIFVTRSSI